MQILFSHVTLYNLKFKFSHVKFNIYITLNIPNLKLNIW